MKLLAELERPVLIQAHGLRLGRGGQHRELRGRQAVEYGTDARILHDEHQEAGNEQ